MSEDRNQLGQPVGRPVEGWSGAQRPTREPMAGRYCRVEPLEPARHATSLFSANAADTNGAMWTYMGYGPFASLEDYGAWAERACRTDDPSVPCRGRARHRPGLGCGQLPARRSLGTAAIEVGHIAFAPALQRTTAATEAMYLMMRRAFEELGYRRYEWKCNALNEASRRAAVRLGFSFEGVFRQAMVVKGRNRDTAWYAVIDREWPALKAAYEDWLAPANFDRSGRQRRDLGSLTAAALSRQTTD